MKGKIYRIIFMYTDTRTFVSIWREAPRTGPVFHGTRNMTRFFDLLQASGLKMDVLAFGSRDMSVDFTRQIP